MATNFASSTVSGGDDATATQYNNLRSDVVKNAGDFEVTGGTGSAYTLAVDASITSYTEGDKFRMQLSANCNATPTLNVNSIGAKTMKKLHDDDIQAGDYLADQIIEVVYQANDDIFEVLTAPAISARSKIDSDGAGTSVISTASETDLITMTVPGGTLNTNNGVMLKSFIHVDCNSAVTTALIFKLYYGTTVIATINANTGSVNTLDFDGYLDAMLVANAATNAQVGSFGWTLIEDSSKELIPGNDTDAYTTSGYAHGTAAEDSTGDLTFKVTVQPATSSAGLGVTARHFLAWKVIG